MKRSLLGPLFCFDDFKICDFCPFEIVLPVIVTN